MDHASFVRTIRDTVERLEGSRFPISAPAKVNLRLKVVGRRSDGYHELSMLNCTIGLADQLGIWFTSDGAVALEVQPESAVAGDPEKNLVVRAFREYWSECGVVDPPCGFTCFLTKTVPTGAGLGGGSSDAAAVLRLLAGVFGDDVGRHTGWSEAERWERLTKAAARCGADVPYSLAGGICRVSGIGDIVEPLHIEVPETTVLLAVPPEAVPTPVFYDYYRAQVPRVAGGDDAELNQFCAAGRSDVASMIANDFEPYVCELCPPVGEALGMLREFFPSASGVTGSGSAVFALVSRGMKEEAANAILELAALGCRTFHVPLSK